MDDKDKTDDISDLLVFNDDLILPDKPLNEPEQPVDNTPPSSPNTPQAPTLDEIDKRINVMAQNDEIDINMLLDMDPNEIQQSVANMDITFQDDTWIQDPSMPVLSSDFVTPVEIEPPQLEIAPVFNGDDPMLGSGVGPMITNEAEVAFEVQDGPLSLKIDVNFTERLNSVRQRIRILTSLPLVENVPFVYFDTLLNDGWLLEDFYPGFGMAEISFVIYSDRLLISEVAPYGASPNDSSWDDLKLEESPAYVKLRHDQGLPLNVADWTQKHTEAWIRWARLKFTTVRMPHSMWKVDGPTLMALNKDVFLAMVANDEHDHFWQHVKHLRNRGMGVLPLSGTDKENNLTQKNGKKAKTAKKKSVVLGRYKQANNLMNINKSSNIFRSGNNGLTIQLWKFMLQTLIDSSKTHILRWVSGPNSLPGEFKIIDPEALAALWGQKKDRKNMDFSKMSRALRYYNEGDILGKVKGKRLHYRFVCDLREMIGYSPDELMWLMSKQQQ